MLESLNVDYELLKVFVLYHKLTVKKLSGVF